METVQIHLRPNSFNRTRNLFLLFLPAIIFAVLVAFLFSKYEKGQLASTKENTAVLGEETIQP